MGGKKKKPIVEEELKPKAPQVTEFMGKGDMDKTQFISFMPEDGVYPDKTFILKGNRCLKIVMRELLKQLNWLRYLSFKQFWATVQFNLSLKYCLQSCLLFLQRRKYNEYLHANIQQDDQGEQQEYVDKLPSNQEVLEYQQHIYKIVLIVYFRILQSQDEDPILSKQFKCAQSVYDNWIMDIPKLFNFMEIYGESNPEITKILAEKVFQINADYKLDFNDVLNTMSRHIFVDIFQDFKFLHDRSEFEAQITQDTLRKKMKHFLLIKDITTSFVNVFEFFPLEAKIFVISSDVLVPLENLYYEIFTAYKNWQFNQFKESVHSLMDSIQEDIILIWGHIFRLIRKVILEETNMSYIPDFYRIKDDVIENMNFLGQQFGIVASQGKKGKQKRNYMLLEQILQDFELKEFLEQLLDLENKKIIQPKIKQLLNVVDKLTQLKQKRLNQNTEEQVIEQKKESSKDDISQSNKSLSELVNVRKQSSHKIQKAESKQQKQDKINVRMQKIRKPQRLQKTNEREYDDEYDDYYDFNRKIEENAVDSDDQIQQISDNPNRRFIRNNKQPEKSITSGTGGTGGRYQQKNSKYSEKKSFKQGQKSDNKSYYRESNKRDEGYKRDDNYKRGDRKDTYKLGGGGGGGGKKQQYRQK